MQDYTIHSRLHEVELQIRSLRNTVRLLSAIILVLVLVTFASGQSPRAELADALRDASDLGPAAASARYLSLAAVSDEHRTSAAAAVSFVLNSVSRSGVIVIPERISPTLLRLDLFAIAPETDDRKQWSESWESLVGVDPYWHQRTQVVDVANTKHGPQLVNTDGGWVGLDAAEKLRQLTGSGGAILRADWWLAHVAAPPYYYAFAGVPTTRGAWLSGLGIVPDVVIDLYANRGANLVRSGVTNRLRRISRWPGPLGALWNTYDSVEQRADQDPFRNPTFAGKFDAGEHIAARANGLLEYALFDASGKRLDAVDAALAIDYTVHPPVPLVPMLSCVRCHSETVENVPQDGLRYFADQQHQLAEAAGLKAGDPKTAQQLALFYGRQAKLQREASRDRQDYAEAVSLCTGGLSVADAAGSIAATYDRYATDSVDSATAERELGIEAGGLPAVIGATTEPALVLLAQGQVIQRAQWEAVYGVAAIAAERRN